MADDPKISIVIPSYNQGKFIGRALASLVAQNDPNLEVIVMDGGSTDNSVEVIQQFSDIISYWQSQPDGGQSAAINAGFRRAAGAFVTWFNTDDILVPGALRSFRRCFRRHPDCDWFCGSTLWINTEDRIIHVGRQERMGRLFNSSYFLSAGPSAFMRKALLEKLGYLKEDFHYLMDQELWYRLMDNGVYMERIPGYTWAIRVHENSKTMGRFSEDKEMYARHEAKVQAERDRLKSMFPGRTIYAAGKWLKMTYYLNKIFDGSIFSHIHDRRLLGKKIGEIGNQEEKCYE